ncbi:MAG: UPF0175 family protein [Bacteroidia bacterium]|nr:UPF0175 family protein [Bacteroidia bacterium]
MIIPDNYLSLAGISQEELRLEVALIFYQRGNISLGKAAEFAEVSRHDFQQEMSRREIPVNYDIEAFKKDMKTIGL